MTRWTYQDATGVWREGTYKRCTDHGGTDVTYWFKRDDGTLDLVSGERLKKAERIWHTELMKRYEGQGPELTEAEMDELRRLENT